MDLLASVIDNTRMCLEELEKQGDMNVTLANLLEFFKLELEWAYDSSYNYSLDEHARGWVNFLEKHLLQPIRMGRMSVDLLGRTMYSLLEIIDDCLTIDNIYKCLEELENEGDLKMHVEDQIQTLKHELRNLKIHFKWRTFSCDTLCNLDNLIGIRSWVRDAEERLLQPTRKGCITADLLEETLFCLLHSMKQTKIRLFRSGCHCLWIDELPFNFDYTKAPISDVLEWIDRLLDNLKHRVRWNELSSVISAKEQIETLVEKLGFLRNFLQIAGIEFEEATKNGTQMLGLLHNTMEDLLTRIKRLIYKATYVSWYSLEDGEHQSMDKFFLISLDNIDHIEPEIRMIYVQLLKASKIANTRTLEIDLQALVAVDSLLDNLQKLLKDQDTGSFMHLDVQQIEFVCQELHFLKYFLMDPHVKMHNEAEAQNFNSLLIEVEAVARELGASLTTFDCFQRTKYLLADEMHLLLPNLQRTVNFLKIEIRSMYRSIPRQSKTNFPRCPKLGYVNFFIQSLEELLQHRADSIAYVKNEVKTLQSELTLLNFFIRDTNKNLENNENIASRIVDVAYEAKQVIDLISASHSPKWYNILWLSDVNEKIETLRKDCSEVHSEMPSESNKVENISLTNNTSRAYNLAIDEEMVGFHAEAEMIIDRLTRGTKRLDIVSIVGMPGLGKTTLAKKVYEHPLITSHFHVCSWYCISQVYDRQDLLRKILDDLRQRPCERNDEDKAQELYKSLKGKRYLIILDDIWSIGPWNNIRNSFPDDCNGSRILFTSRIREVALEANRGCGPLDLRLFSNEESWKLLKKKVFQSRSCPKKLRPIGKKIAENCKGLPLSVVLIAGVLVKVEESEDHWKKVLASLGKQVGDLSKCILELSYKQLPDHLKACFLYFGAFPEDKAIMTRDLVRMWIAEGFIEKTQHESLENVAEGYLMDLIARSLVLIAQSKSIGGVKSCHVHDLLHEFSKEKAKDENFLLISKKMPYDLEQCRLCCYFDDEKYLCGWIPYDPYVRSIFLYSTIDRYANFSDVPFVLSHSLRLLHVLNLKRIFITSHQFQRLTESLVHLRYLAIEGPLEHVPSSVANLWRLETFIFSGVSKVKLPEALLEMAYLKHVYVNVNLTCDLELSDHTGKSIKSSCIEKFSTLSLYPRTMDKVIRRLRSLRKLKCQFLGFFYQNEGCRQFPELDLLSELESLNISCFIEPDKITLYDISFPSNLKKLTLSGLGLSWSEISKIGKLPQLQVLKLFPNALVGPRWDASDDEFCNLECLKLVGLDIEVWDASPDAFSCLEHLVLANCERLREIPSSFEESSTLRMIEVKRCTDSVNEAALKIKEHQQNQLGVAGFKVFIQRQLSQSYLESDSHVNSDSDLTFVPPSCFPFENVGS